MITDGQEAQIRRLTEATEAGEFDQLTREAVDYLISQLRTVTE